ncbi:MAG: hypothetical protein MZV63_21585 [Marinilabiliales bacterium]|nr:hypothetical protein [Marinilabiliales bacterium]
MTRGREGHAGAGGARAAESPRSTCALAAAPIPPPARRFRLLVACDPLVAHAAVRSRRSHRRAGPGRALGRRSRLAGHSRPKWRSRLNPESSRWICGAALSTRWTCAPNERARDRDEPEQDRRTEFRPRRRARALRQEFREYWRRIDERARPTRRPSSTR